MNIVTFVGKLQGMHTDNMRILEVARPESVDSSNNLQILCKYWTNDACCALTSLKEGALVAIRGRIDSDEANGIHVIVEQLIVIKN